ncbi:HYR domain-containing protein [Sunxiuqinia indica]|uniref:HYR domain-containing protein n=1 Tax=Sunxiuqinia indica TaxID=2692584 RepID=UPI00135BCEAC|nr:HYR domain-containing protein [Sunxiuqinia indica]
MRKRFITLINGVFFLALFFGTGSFYSIQAQITNEGFEDSSATLTGWTQNGATVSTGTTITGWTVNPADSQMAHIIPVGSYMQSAAETELNLTSGSLSFSSATNFGILYQDVVLLANQEITFWWNYVSEDYDPYDDGSFASFSKVGYQEVITLVRTVSSGLVPATGDYGSSGWHTVTFTAPTAGTYRLGFGCFNYSDQSANPHLFVDDGAGGTMAPGYPVLTTNAVSSVTGVSATCGGNITSVGTGASSITAHGVCWSTAVSPTISGSHTTDGAGTGSYTSTITGLTTGLTYYVRAYATNNLGNTAYGGTVTFIAENTNTPPVANNDGTYNANTGGTVSGNVLTNDTDADGDDLDVTTEPTLSQGSFTSFDLETGAFVYQAPTNYVGTFTFSYTATDGTATDNATAMITVADTIVPVVTTQNITVQLDASGSASITTTDINNGSTDNIGITGLSLDKTSFDCSKVGANTVSLTAVDAAGNSASNTATVTVEDNVDPSLTVQNITVQLDASGSAMITAADLVTSASDNCTVQDTTINVSSFDCGDIGSNSVQVTLNDVNGNSTSKTATVTVEDNVDPSLTVQNITVQLDASGSAMITAADLVTSASDNCTVQDTTINVSSFDCGDIGSNSVQVTLNDVNSNSTSKTATVTVEDTTDPEIVPPVNLSFYADSNQCGTYVNVKFSTFDNCNSNGNLAYNGNANGSLNGWNITQNYGNGWAVSGGMFVTSYATNIKSQVIDLLAQGYDTATLNAAPNITVSEDYIGRWPNYGDTYFLNVQLRDAQGAVITTFNTGNLTCTNSLQTISHTFSGYGTGVRYIFVEHGGKDAEFWVGHYGSKMDNLQVLVDTPSITPNLPVQQTHGIPLADMFPVGTTTNSYIIMDMSGNTSSTSFDVVVEDTISPTLSVQNLKVQLDASGNVSIVAADLVTSASDNCTIQDTTLSVSSFDCGDIGSNSVQVTLNDVNSNSTSKTAMVTVEDNVDPALTVKDTTLYLDIDGNASIVVADVVTNASDNCTIQDTTLSISSFSCDDLFTPVPVDVTLTDVNSNSTVEVSTVTILDTITPVAICQDTTVYLDATGNIAIDPTFIDNGSSDNCSFDLSLDITAFDCSNVGENAVVLTAEDASGNSSQCQSTVTVLDTIAPIAICKDITISLDTLGAVIITPDMIDNGSYDACTEVVLEIESDAAITLSCEQIGENELTLSVTDIYGNVSTCVSTVTVEDNSKPVAICKDVTVYLDETGFVQIDGPTVDNGSYDACGVHIVPYVNTEKFHCDDLGPNLITLTVNDYHGNYDFCESIVTVADSIKPEIDSMEDISTVVASADDCSVVVEFETPTATDICGGVTVEQTAGLASGSEFPVGTTVVTFTATDASGNTSESSFAVTVAGINKAPVIDAIADQTVSPYIVTMEVPLSGISAGDDCMEQIVSTITAEAADPSLVTVAVVTYIEEEETAVLTLTLAGQVSGSSEITVTLKDNAGTANGGVDETSTSFTVTVLPNSAPEANGSIDTVYIDKNSTKTVELAAASGLFSDNDEGDELSISATAEDGSALPDWISMNEADMKLTLSPTADELGEHKFMLTATDKMGATASVEIVVVVQIPTGFDELTSEFGYRVYPNPTDGFIKVDVKNGDLLEGEIFVRNLVGQEIHRQVYQLSDPIMINLSGQVGGIYFVTLKLGDKEFTKKIIKK